MTFALQHRVLRLLRKERLACSELPVLDAAVVLRERNGIQPAGYLEPRLHAELRQAAARGA